MIHRVTFLNYPCILWFGKYNNGRTAIELIEEATHEPFCTASVNLVNEQLTGKEIAIKDYSENAGICRMLQIAGIISAPFRYASSGHVTIPICHLLIDPVNPDIEEFQVANSIEAGEAKPDKQG